MPIDLGPIRPLQDRVASELAAVVTDDHHGFATFLDDPIKLTGTPQTGKRCIGDEAQAFPGAIVYDRQNPEPATIGISIGARVPIARFRPPRLRTVSFSSR